MRLRSEERSIEFFQGDHALLKRWAEVAHLQVPVQNPVPVQVVQGQHELYKPVDHLVLCKTARRS